MAESAARLRELVRHRAGDRCEYCRMPRAAERNSPFHLEHIVAQQHGGPTTLANLAWACQPCNARKGPNLSGIDPLDGAILTLFNPRLDRWEDHFLSRGDGRVDGVTATGRATVAVLDMNAPPRPLMRMLTS